MAKAYQKRSTKGNGGRIHELASEWCGRLATDVARPRQISVQADVELAFPDVRALVRNWQHCWQQFPGAYPERR